MKNLNLLLLCSILFLSQSCKEDSCPETNCNTGVINTETCACDCPDGFSSTTCETEDLCVTQSVDCKNGGTCSDGTCICPNGYEGSDCSELWRAKYLNNNYIAVLKCGSDMTPIGGGITLDPTDELKMNIYIFNQMDIAISVDLLTSVTFDIPEQETNSVPISGSGFITDNDVILFHLTNEPHCIYAFTPF